uniref:ribosomal protein L16 n=1 Tax=Phyllospadix iwatensis TaxID=214525 RepID=UPI00226D0512|nr:ribosomal protein L16 [Phyllospadix iwatensis]UZH94082.1 ribosomal protein L16 [Phyllospadix iwatensis]
MLTHKTTPLPESFAGPPLQRRRTTARRGFTAQGPCRGKAWYLRIEDAQLRTT